MMKYIFLLLATVYIHNCIAQGIEEEGFIKPFDPNIRTTPNPDAYNMTTYGNTNINESLGKFIYDLPLYTYKVNKLELPISLNYFGAGVKVNDLASKVGVNFTLNAGGVITRTVYHNPDELAINRIFPEDIEDIITNQNIYSQNDDAQSICFLFKDNIQNDTQPDIFSFSFLKYNGQFYLDENFNPVSISPNTDYKIEIVGSDNNNKQNFLANKYFKITTPDGIKYHFGLNYTEDTQTNQINAQHNIITPLATTSFYLFKIESPISSETINLEYDDLSFYSISTKKEFSCSSYKYYVGISYDEDFIECPVGHQISNPCFEKLNYEGQIFNAQEQNINNGKYLTKVYSNIDNTKIIFNYNFSINSRKNFKGVLNSIQVINSQNNIIQFDLEYIYNYDNLGIAQRFFLKNIYINKDKQNTLDLTRKFKKFHFEYYNPILPKRFSKNQDHAGFPNMNNTIHFLPNVTDSDKYRYFDYFHANRDSDFNTRISGALRKIIYPTGGRTEIEYEAPLKKEIKYENVNLDTYLNNYENNINTYTDSFTIGGSLVDPNGNPSPSNGVFQTQDVIITITTDAINEIVHARELVSFSVIDITDPINTITIEQRDLIINPTNNQTLVDVQKFNIHFIKNHKYSIILNLSTTTNYTFPIHSNLSFKYLRDYQLKNGEGIRVKRVSDYTHSFNSTPANVKRYYYTKAENIFKRPIEYVDVYKTPNYLKTQNFYIHTCMGYCANRVYLDAPLTHQLEVYSGAYLISTPWNYTNFDFFYDNVVISYGGDNFENGGIEKKFNKDMFSPVLLENNSEMINEDFNTFFNEKWVSASHGSLKESRTIIKKQDVLFAINDIKYHKSYSNDLSFRGSVGSFHWNIGLGPTFPLSNLTYGYYSIYNRKIVQTTVTEKNYIDPYPLQENVLGELPDDTPYKKIITNKVINYNSGYKGLATRIQKNNSKTDENIIILNSFIDEKDDLLEPNGNNATISAVEYDAYTELENSHIINNPIQQTKQLLNNLTNQSKTLETQRITYQIYNNKVFPKKIQFSKGQYPLTDRIIFIEYDNNGNLSKLYRTKGVITKYEYNNIGQVVTKIENFKNPITLPYDNSENTINCNRNRIYPHSLVTTYDYDINSHLLKSKIDSKCSKTSYEYDVFHRLKYIKDNDGNIIKEFDNNYRRF